jgi:hypothetical protein
VGTTIAALETRSNGATVRVHFEGGWVSEHAGNGATCLEPVDGTAGAALDLPPAGSAPKPAQTSDAQPAAAPVPPPKPEPEPEPVPEPETQSSSGPKECAKGQQAAPAPAPAPQSYKCVKKSLIRAGFEMDSEKAGVLAVGTTIAALETRSNGATVRVHFEGGWVSEHAGNGATCLEPVDVPGPSPAEGRTAHPPIPKKASQETQAPAPAPTPQKPREVVVTMALADCAPGHFKCLKKSQVRAGAEMDSAKAGILNHNEKIEVLESVELANGLVRCRFADGWVSAQASSGEPILERMHESSGESLKCGNCQLDKEAYDVCRKMARSSKLKNVAIMLKIVLVRHT